MSRTVLYRVLLFVVLAAAAVVFLVPTFLRPAPVFWPWHQPVRLGLDLQGGTHLLYGVEIEQAINNTVDRHAQDLERELRDAQIGAVTVEREGKTVRLRLANKEKRQQVVDLVKERFPTLVTVPSQDADADLTLTLEQRDAQRIRDNVVDQALKIIRNRIDQFGVSEPTVQAQGADEIVVQLPGIQDPQRAKDLIGKTALLEFKLLATGPQAGTVEHPGPGVQVLNGKGDAGGRRAYLVERRTLMTGDVITDASVRPGTASTSRSTPAARSSSPTGRTPTWVATSPSCSTTTWSPPRRFASRSPPAAARSRGGSTSPRRRTWRMCCATGRCPRR